jgi:hypothetical protein
VVFFEGGKRDASFPKIARQADPWYLHCDAIIQVEDYIKARLPHVLD